MAGAPPPRSPVSSLPAVVSEAPLPECPPGAYLLRILPGRPGDPTPKPPPAPFMSCSMEEAQRRIALGEPIPLKKPLGTSEMSKREKQHCAAAARQASQ
eukprot:9943771-Alexandrium_andersonii.AAC.1